MTYPTLFWLIKLAIFVSASTIHPFHLQVLSICINLREQVEETQLTLLSWALLLLALLTPSPNSKLWDKIKLYMQIIKEIWMKNFINQEDYYKISLCCIYRQCFSSSNSNLCSVIVSLILVKYNTELITLVSTLAFGSSIVILVKYEWVVDLLFFSFIFCSFCLHL